MPRKLLSTTVLLFALNSPETGFAFSGEDVLNGQPWHHADITLRALGGEALVGAIQSDVFGPCGAGVGFSPEAATSIAWHADYLDSYLYNPLWWAEGAPDKKRLKASIALFEDLAKLHHDDTFTTAGLEDNWRRYSAGALLGLAFAARTDDVAAAHNILGLLAHANQDFYSHTNWVDDPERQRRTWFEYRDAFFFDPMKDYGAGSEGVKISTSAYSGCITLRHPQGGGYVGTVLQSFPGGTTPAPGASNAASGAGVGVRLGSGPVLTGPTNNDAIENTGAGDQQSGTGGWGGGDAGGGIGGPEIVIAPELRHLFQNKPMPALYSGSYEEAESGGQHAHGKYSPSCSALEASGLAGTLAEICGDVSPLQGMPFCIMSRACSNSPGVDTSALGVSVESILYQQPAGIALDTIQLARVGSRTRGLVDDSGNLVGAATARQTWGPTQCHSIVNFGSVCDISGATPNCSVCGVKTVDEGLAIDPTGLGRAVLGNCKVTIPRPACTVPADFIFADAKYLAILSTQELFQHLGDAMARIDPAENDDYEKFWRKVRTEGTVLGDHDRDDPNKNRIGQFEELFRVPFQFMTAGPYPVGNPVSGGDAPAVQSSDGWYLRLRLKTSDFSDAGTDADIVATVAFHGGDVTLPLDYLPTNDAEANVSSPLLVYDDFEQGDNDVYTIGPFPSLPESVSLANNAADVEDVLGALLDDIGSSVDNALTDLRRSLTSLYGANADFVGTAKIHETADEVLARGVSPDGSTVRFFVVDGGTEGRFQINYSERLAPEFLSDLQKSQGWIALEFTVTDLHCDRESDVDGGSSADEPLLFVLGSSMGNTEPGGSVGQQFGPLADVDDGETHALDQSKKIVVKFPRQGGYVLALQLWESDSEQGSDQYEIGQTFFTGISEEVRRGNGRFLRELGKSLAEDWSLDQFEATPFYRGEFPALGETTRYDNVGWIDGGNSRSFDLGQSVLELINGAAIGNWQ